MRRNYLLNQNPKEFIWLKNSDQLNKHLTAINLQAHEMEDIIVEKLKENSPEYKEAENQGDYLKTVQLQNSFLKTAEEEILTELIYK
ncbi:TnpV protein [Porcipelethomonas ammoniilytica]|uniref:TnpV protein n=1 Tax=Porcipelethomonas ammoniilytica TaxID=2981722 RepID=UPI00374DC091